MTIKKVRGFTLIEMSIVILIMTLLAAYKIREESRDLRLGLAKAQGEQLKVLASGLYNYGVAHFGDLVNGVNIAGVAVDTAPTVGELKTLGYLNTSFSATTAYGGGYLLQIEKAPVGCTSNCNIAGLAYLAQPLLDPMSGTVDGPAIGQAVNAIGADGGASLPAAASIKGKSGGWTVANPLNQVGIIGVRVGEGSALDMSAYLKRDGSLPMTGNLDMGGNAVTNLAAAAIGDACTTPGSVASGPGGEVLSCQSGTYQSQGSAYWKDPVLNVASLPTCDATSAWHTRIVQVPPSGTGASVFTCNGAAWEELTAEGGAPAGLYGYFNAATCPSGWVVADGANGTVDLRGEFIRGLDAGRGVDTGRVLASSQTDLFKAHNHYAGHGIKGDIARQFGTTGNLASVTERTSFSGGQPYTSTTGGTETRPRNVALLPCMKS